MIRTYPQRGYILLPVVLLITLVATSAFLLNNESALETDIAASNLEAKQAEHVAKAGLTHALWHAGQQGCGPYTDLTNQPLDTHSYTTTLTTGLGSTSSYTLAVDQDTWIRSDQPTVNYASDSKLHIRFETGIIERPLYRYDLSPIAANSNILSATAWFYVSKEHPQGPVDIHLLNYDWTETDATWDSMGDKMDPAVQATIPTQPVAGVWVAVNLTSQVQAWVNGLPNLGITLNSVSEGTHGDYASTEAAQQPYLEVIVGTPVASAQKLKSRATLASGITRTINLQKPGLYQQPSHRMLLQATVKDVMLSAFYSSKNYGDYRIRVSAASGSLRNSLIQFDLSAIPPGARVLSAKMQLHHTITDDAGADAVVSVHRVPRDWVEGTGSGGGGADGATWDTYDSNNAWAKPGGDYDPAVVASSSISGATGDWESWDISTLVRDWVDGRAANYGLLLKGSGTVAVSFASKEDANPALHPKLSITYACECGSPCVAILGSGNILMVVSDDFNLTAGEQAKKALFERWGYSVDLIAQWNVDWNFGAKAANNDVVYVSEAVTSTTFGMAPKLAATSLGVVSEEGGINDELGFSSGNAWLVGDTIAITDTSHYITQPFATGDLQFYAAAMDGLSVSGSEAGGLQTLADWGGAGSLVVLDTGAALDGGGTAAGRRVMLPLGRDGNVNLDYLTASGRLIVQRALAWGMGADNMGTGKQLLLVVANAGSPASEEDAKRSLIETWGYPVTLIDDSDSQANFDAALAGNDIAYISSTVSSVELGAKLTNTAIGVVNENGSLVEELGFGEQVVVYRTNNEIKVIDNTHYITKPLPAGLLPISFSYQNLLMMPANKAPGFDALAEVYNTGTLYDESLGVIDAGGQLFSGGTATGRRVLLPWGDANFDVTALNSDGKTIMRRAIEWASTVPEPKTPLAHWKLDETIGTTAVDSEGGHDGTLINGPIWSGGRVDGGLRYDGGTDFVNVPHDDSLSLSSFSISAWIRPSALSGWQVIVNKGTTTSAVNYYLATNDDEIGLGFYNAGWVAFDTTSANLTTNQWYHVAATYDDASREGKIYLDGTLIHNSTVAVSPLPNGDALTIGRSGFGEYWPGLLDDVRIYNEVLTDSDIADLAVPPLRLPIAHWQLDETAGTTAVDSVGGHHGTLVNGPAWTGGHVDGALQFDGVDDYVDLTSNAELDDIFVGGATVTAWINPAGWGTSDYARIFDKSSSASSTGAGWVLRVDGNEDRINFGQGFSGGRGWWRTPFDSTTLGSWQHIAVVYDAGSTANDPVIYINGSPVAVTRVEAPSGDALSDASINLRLGNYAGGTTHTFDGKMDDARIYDVMLDASEVAALAQGGGGGPGPGGCNGTYLDGFDTASWSGSNGTLDWSTSPWAEVGESDGAGNGDVQMEVDLSNSRLRIRDNQNGGEGVERIADLDGAASATLSLDYRRQALDNANDYVAVYLSTNGMAGPWDEIVRFQGGDNDTVYQPYSLDISGYISAQTAIRLRSSTNMGNNDIVWFDNVQIECTP